VKPPLLEAPTDFTSFDLAEWLEISMVLDGATEVSAAEIESWFPQNQRPDAAEIEQLFAEIRSRAAVAPNLYPFRAIDEEIVVDRDVDPTVYYLLLVLSVERAPFRKEYRFNEISPSLELITREAMLALLGARGQGRRFGWPNSDGRPEHLAEAVEWLAAEMGLGVGVVREDVDDDDKDGGIDVAAWHPFADGAPSFPVFLIQVTTEATYERKPGDVVPEQWISWIRFGREPQIGLSVPFAIPIDAKVRLSKLRYSANLLLDRLRLCQLLDPGDLSVFDEYEFMRRWTVDEVEKLVIVLSQPDAQRRPKLAKPRRPRGVSSPPDAAVDEP
jgi:CRISPR-associated Cas5-like protein